MRLNVINNLKYKKYIQKRSVDTKLVDQELLICRFILTSEVQWSDIVIMNNEWIKQSTVNRLLIIFLIVSFSIETLWSYRQGLWQHVNSLKAAQNTALVFHFVHRGNETKKTAPTDWWQMMTLLAVAALRNSARRRDSRCCTKCKNDRALYNSVVRN